MRFASLHFHADLLTVQSTSCHAHGIAQGAPRRPYQGGHDMGPMARPMGAPAMVSYGYGPPIVYHPGYPIRGGYPPQRGRGPPFMQQRGGFNGHGGYGGGRGPYGGDRGGFMGEGSMPERRPPPGTPGISSGFQARALLICGQVKNNLGSHLACPAQFGAM